MLCGLSSKVVLLSEGSIKFELFWCTSSSHLHLSLSPLSGHDECAELLLQVASGPAPSDDLNMSMAEAFVSLYDLTQVTQLTLHQNSPTPTHLTEAQGTDSAANCPRDLGSTRRQLFPESEEGKCVPPPI